MARAEKSTTVRIIVAALRAIARVAPRAATDLATHLFFRAPPRRRTRALELPVLASGERRELDIRGERLVAWRWGTGPAVLLVHGWGGNAAQLHAFVAPLQRAGFAVVAFDLPAHGASTGTSTSIPEVADAVRAVAAELGPLAGVVAHSLGGAATLLALDDGLSAPRVALIAPPAHPRAWFDGWVGRIVGDPHLADARARAEAALGIRFARLEGAHLAARGRGELLVIHDRGDREVSVDEGRAIADAWPDATLVETVDLGHRRILDDPRVVGRVAAFLSGSEPSASGCGHIDGDLPCERCAIALELSSPASRWSA